MAYPRNILHYRAFDLAANLIKADHWEATEDGSRFYEELAIQNLHDIADTLGFDLVERKTEAA